MHRSFPFGFAQGKDDNLNSYANLRSGGADGPSAFGHGFPICRFNPDFFSGGYTQGNPACTGGQGQRVVVIAMRDMNFGSGADAALFKKLQQAPIAFIDTTHLKVLPWFGLSKQEQAATAPAGGTLQFRQIAVRTRD